MKNKIRNIIVISIILLLIILTIGGAVAMYSYSKLGSNNNKVIAGDIYMRYINGQQKSITMIPSDTYNEDDYFEFTINGKNTSDKDINYDIILNHGINYNNPYIRLNDIFLRFRLVTVNNNAEKEIFNNKSFDSINNTRIHADLIEGGTNTEISITYRLYIWVNGVIVGNVSEANYTSEQWTNVYTNISVDVNGDFTNKAITINKIEDLVDLSNAVNSGTTYSGVYVNLMRNLDFEDTNSYEDSTRTDYGDINGNGTVETLINELTNTCNNCGGFIPIGKNQTNSFQGNFNGNNYRIDNLYENNVNKSQDTGILGLFGVIKNSDINNLTVDGNFYINTINNAGGIVGTNYGTSIINNCHNEANLTSVLPNYSIGGIVGSNGSNLTIDNSSNSGVVSGSNNAGGIIGYINGTLIIQNSYNSGNISNNLGSNVGGLLGRDESTSNLTTITNSHNEGVISSNRYSSDTYIGGLVGNINNISIRDSYNSGNIIGTNENLSIGINLGGFIGIVRRNINIDNSYNSGNIQGGNRLGGIIGTPVTSSNLILNKVYNTGNISSTISNGSNKPIIGGIISGPWYSNISVLNSYSIGEISSNYIGSGIIGSTDNSSVKIINCYNFSNINSNNNSSGIVKITNNITNILMKNVYNLGGVSGNDNLSGISFIASDIDTSKVTLTNIYYINNVLNGINGATSLNQYTTSMSESDMKSQSFVNTLNNNLSGINLSSIDSSLSGYTLSHWKLGRNGYPVFEWQ